MSNYQPGEQQRKGKNMRKLRDVRSIDMPGGLHRKVFVYEYVAILTERGGDGVKVVTVSAESSDIAKIRVMGKNPGFRVKAVHRLEEGDFKP